MPVVSIIGCGTLGTILLSSLCKLDPSGYYFASVRSRKSAEALCNWVDSHYPRDQFPNIRVMCSKTDSEEISKSCAQSDVVILAVKPSQIDSIKLPSYAPDLEKRKEIAAQREKKNNNNNNVDYEFGIPLVISVMSGVTHEMLLSNPNIRAFGEAITIAMPNTPCEVGYGMTSLFYGGHVIEDHKKYVGALFSGVGRSIELFEEKQLPAATAIAGCGPAYVYMMIEAISDAGVRLGLRREVARELAAQTLCGGGAMVLATDRHPALLRDQVTTPGGCTIAGLTELEEGGLRGMLIRGIMAAANRAREMSNK